MWVQVQKQHIWVQSALVLSLNTLLVSFLKNCQNTDCEVRKISPKQNQADTIQTKIPKNILIKN